MLGEAVTDNDIALVVSRATGIPVHNLMMGEREKLLQMEKTLAARVKGQNDAVSAVRYNLLSQPLPHIEAAVIRLY
jgi:ATP-dependent Clp protease ATP-binding subunit ClpB